MKSQEKLLLENLKKLSDNKVDENILNDMGTISTCYGVLKSYDITIKFNWSDFDE